ncbi:GspH/FimT family pseudopilin [Candidatus Nitrosacidococcus sp. I8]|uniref:GspH/FimT family pseudopilin n=1 Tax=Candidatus Nitrosacidococcus sp. I8 TaxID=2942908 RepID=UPI0022269FFB|nr:GspH/FimT family pseudopilin [Candidatus Nitrosacidococcus sp. I8]CAH9015130.1 hypothetical protein NURINAE_00144 [Candidatus Nitrosacidococcus sp. I8]
MITKNQIGFTLVELLVVLTLAGIMISLVPPMLEGKIAGTEIRGAARRLAAGLKYTRSYAITYHKEAALTLDLESRSFTITDRERKYSLPKNIEIDLVTARSQVDSDRSGKIKFFPDGTSTGGRVTLERGTSKYQVDINWLTGQIKILD